MSVTLPREVLIGGFRDYEPVGAGESDTVHNCFICYSIIERTSRIFAHTPRRTARASEVALDLVIEAQDLTAAHHPVHEECMRIWLQHNPICPLCPQARVPFLEALRPRRGWEVLFVDLPDAQRIANDEARVRNQQFIQAAIEGNEERLRALLPLVDSRRLSAREQILRSAIVKAAAFGHVGVITVLIQQPELRVRIGDHAQLFEPQRSLVAALAGSVRSGLSVVHSTDDEGRRALDSSIHAATLLLAHLNLPEFQIHARRSSLPQRLREAVHFAIQAQSLRFFNVLLDQPEIVALLNRPFFYKKTILEVLQLRSREILRCLLDKGDLAVVRQANISDLLALLLRKDRADLEFFVAAYGEDRLSWDLLNYLCIKNITMLDPNTVEYLLSLRGCRLNPDLLKASIKSGKPSVVVALLRYPWTNQSLRQILLQVTGFKERDFDLLSIAQARALEGVGVPKSGKLLVRKLQRRRARFDVACSYRRQFLQDIYLGVFRETLFRRVERASTRTEWIAQAIIEAARGKKTETLRELMVREELTNPRNVSTFVKALATSFSYALQLRHGEMIWFFLNGVALRPFRKSFVEEVLKSFVISNECESMIFLGSMPKVVDSFYDVFCALRPQARKLGRQRITQLLDKWVRRAGARE